MRKKDVLNFENRRNIYNLIVLNPGFHLSEISKKIDIPKTTLLYHLKYLEKKDLILKKSEDGFCRYYATNKVSAKNKKIFSILRHEIPRKILFYIIFHKDYPTQIEISKYLKKHPATVSFHIEKLIDCGLIEKITFGKKIKYKVNTEHDFYNFFITYDKTILNDLMPFALEWWDYNISINRIDKIMDFIYEILPHPYYN